MSPAKHPVGEKIHINSSKNYTPLVSNVGTTPKETGTRGKTMTLVQHSRRKNLPRSRRLPLVDTGLAFASAVATPHGDILVRCRWVCSLQTREPTSAAAFIAALTTRIRRAVATRRLLLSGIKYRSLPRVGQRRSRSSGEVIISTETSTHSPSTAVSSELFDVSIFDDVTSAATAWQQQMMLQWLILNRGRGGRWCGHAILFARSPQNEKAVAVSHGKTSAGAVDCYITRAAGAAPIAGRIAFVTARFRCRQ